MSTGYLPPAFSSYDAALIAQKGGRDMQRINFAGQWVFCPASVDHPGGVTGSLTENYQAILMGDVSGDWDPMGARPEVVRRFGVKDVMASVPVVRGARSSEVVVPFRLDDLGGIGVGSYQFDLAYDPTVISPAAACKHRRVRWMTALVSSQIHPSRACSRWQFMVRYRFTATAFTSFLSSRWSAVSAQHHL